MDAYVIIITYFLRKMGDTKTTKLKLIFQVKDTSMKNRKKIFEFVGKIVLTIIIFLLPIGVIYFCIPTEYLYAIDNRINVVGLYISAFSLATSIFIAVLIYWLQNNNTKREERLRRQKAQLMMYSELESALEGVYMRAAGFGGIGTGANTKNIMNTYLVELQDILSPNQFRLLINIVNKIDIEASDTSEDEERGKAAQIELIGYMRPWLLKIMYSDYVKLFPCVQDYHDLLSRPVFELLQALGKSNASFEVEKEEIYDMNGNLLFVHKGNRACRIYDGSGILLLDGTIDLDIDDEYKIVDGYEKSETYTGFYKDGKYCGEGTLYSHDKKKLKEGQWNAGELIKGMEYDWLLQKHEDGEWEPYEQYGEDIIPFMYAQQSIIDIGIENFFIADLRINGGSAEEENVRTLAEFLHDTNPEMLKYYE